MTSEQWLTTWPHLLARCGTVCHNSRHWVFWYSKALYPGPECILGPSFIFSPIALGLLSQRRWDATLDWKLPPPAVFLSRCSPAQILYRPQNIILLQQARCVRGKKKGKKEKAMNLGLFLWCTKHSEYGSRFQLRPGSNFSSYVITYGTFSHAGGEQDWRANQKSPLLPWSLTTAVQTCPLQSLFALAKFRTVYLPIRDCLLKLCRRPRK